jgi:hypothetical protein
MENPGTFIVPGHRIAITLSGILNQQWRSCCRAAHDSGRQ